MRLTIVGCSGSFAGPDSPASSYLVRAEHDGRDYNLLLDLGSGALGALQRHLDPADLDAVLVTHLHPDHCVDLLGLYVTRKYRPEGALPSPLPVFAPTGAEERLALAYHGLDDGGMSRELAFSTLVEKQPLALGPFTVTPFRVNHPVEAYGFRVEAAGRVLAYSGDTDACPALSPLFTGSDLVLADAAFVDGRDAAPDIHLSGSRAARAALDAGGVRRLMLTHIPAWNDPEVCRAQAAAVWPGEVELAEPDATYPI
ncbi:MAG TPA: MBL fold metallo-hydrolase [Pedococcus sp.]|jgi:ribonuclease BN (tRNA processing enzyme)|uniref:MBL fold metallo-hydrolase n=1 Tax=Pedococcus sp. TaxID=2860345 RepID=UPI002F932708